MYAASASRYASSVAAIGALGIEEIEQRAGAALIDVGRDLERLPRLIEITGLIETDDLLIRLERGVGVHDVGDGREPRGGFRLERLADRDLAVRDVALIAIVKGRLIATPAPTVLRGPVWE